MNKHIEQSSWDENIEEYHSTPDWVVILISITFAIGLVLVLADYIFGVETVTEFIASIIV